MVKWQFISFSSLVLGMSFLKWIPFHVLNTWYKNREMLKWFLTAWMTLATTWMQINATRQLLDTGAEERTMNGQGCYLSPAWKGSSAFNARGILGQAAVNWGSNESSCRLFNQVPIAHHGKSWPSEVLLRNWGVSFAAMWMQSLVRAKG